MFPTANILERTFRIRSADSIGTCFTIDVDNRQYIITAKHILKETFEESLVQIMHNKQWKDLPVRLVGHCKGHIDISVLAPEHPISPNYSLGSTRDGLALGQDVRFLGFPYGITSEMPSSENNDFPIAFVKKAIVSQGDKDSIRLDGHNNPGFSGGPVVFCPKPNSNDLSVAGVVSGYHFKEEPVYQGQEQTEIGYYKYNTGIIVAYNIKHAIDLISQNPMGMDLKSWTRHMKDLMEEFREISKDQLL